MEVENRLYSGYSRRQQVENILPITPDKADSFKDELESLLHRYKILDMQFSHGTIYIREIKQTAGGYLP